MRNNPQLHEYALDPQVTAFSTTRHGGCSQGTYASLNINPYCGDEESHVFQNRQALCDRLAVRNDRLFLPHQTHHTEVVDITEDLLQVTSPDALPFLLEGKDAITTNITDCCIGVSTADCIPVLLYDPQHHVAAAVHAGWRGTVARIVEKSVLHMQQRYGSVPQRMKAVIGPGISLESFEVGEEVYAAFAEARFPMEKLARRFPAMRKDEVGEKWHIDLPACNQLQLLSAGLPATQILSSGICTYQQSDDFFSARRLGIQSGRIFTGIVLR